MSGKDLYFRLFNFFACVGWYLSQTSLGKTVFDLLVCKPLGLSSNQTGAEKPCEEGWKIARNVQTSVTEGAWILSHPFFPPKHHKTQPEQMRLLHALTHHWQKQIHIVYPTHTLLP